MQRVNGGKACARPGAVASKDRGSISLPIRGLRQGWSLTTEKGSDMKKLLIGLLGVAAAGWAASAASAATLDDVKAKGFVQCGVNTGLAGFAAPNDKGEWAGFDVDYCRAVAAAIFGDPTKVKFTPLSAKDRFPA